MPVSSDDLFKFIKTVSAAKFKANAHGEIESVEPPPLTGEALASAIETVFKLSCAEHEVEFQRLKMRAGMTQMYGGGTPPVAN